MTSLRTTAEGYLMAIEADAISFDDVTAWVDQLMVDMSEPPPAVIEACCAGDDANKLMSELREFPGDLDLSAACRQMIYHMKKALDADPALEPKIVQKLYTVAVENKDVPDKADGDFMRSLQRELGQADDETAAKLRAQLGELLDRGVAPPAGS